MSWQRIIFLLLAILFTLGALAGPASSGSEAIAILAGAMWLVFALFTIADRHEMREDARRAQESRA